MMAERHEDDAVAAAPAPSSAAGAPPPPLPPLPSSPLEQDPHYLVRRSALTPAECASALDEVWSFAEDVGRRSGLRRGVGGEASSRSGPLPSPPAVFRTHGAGWILGTVRERLADAVFEPLFDTREVRCSAEGFALLADPSRGNGPVDVPAADELIGGEEAETEGTEGSPSRYRRAARCFAAFSACEVTFSAARPDVGGAGDADADFAAGVGKEEGSDESAVTVSLGAGDAILWDGAALRLRSLSSAAAAEAEGADGATEGAAAGAFVAAVPAEDLGLASEEEEELRWKSRVAFYHRTLTGDSRPDCADSFAAKGGWKMPDGDGDCLPADEKGATAMSFFRRPYFRYGPPPLTVRQAELHGLVPYRRRGGGGNAGGGGGDGTARAPSGGSGWSDNATVRSIMAHPDREVVRAIFRGVVFSDESYYRLIPEDGESLEDVLSHPKPPFPNSLAVHQERSCTPSIPPVATETLYLDDGDRPLPGQDKYLGGVASPCGEYVFGVPGFARQVLSVHVPTGRVELIGDEYPGPFKWLRGVEIPPGPDHPRGLCVGLPSNANSVLKIDPETQTVSTFGTDSGLLDGVWKYHGGQMYPPTRKLYAIPANARRVLKIDVYTEELAEIGPDFGTGKQKWYGGIYSAHNDCIYGIPHNETGVLKIDPSNDEVTVIGNHLPKGMWKWHGGLATKDGKKIIGFPNNSDSVLIVDVTTDKVYTVNGGTKGVLTSGRHRRPRNGKYKYLGGSLGPGEGRYAYLFPSCAERILRIDTRTDDVRCVGPLLLEGSCKYQNGFSSGGDGCVYGIPQNARCVIRIKPPKDMEGGEEVVDMVYCGDAFLPYGDKFEGGVQSGDGTIWCMPLRAKAVLKVVPPKVASCKVLEERERG